MLIFELKAYRKESQFAAIDEAIRISQFIQNKSLRFWMDNKGVTKYDLNKYSAVLAKEFPFADKLNSMARQSAAERAWSAISRFYDNCKKKVQGKKVFRSSSMIPDRLNIKRLDGSWRTTENLLLLPTKRELVD